MITEKNVNELAANPALDMKTMMDAGLTEVEAIPLVTVCNVVWSAEVMNAEQKTEAMRYSINSTLCNSANIGERDAADVPWAYHHICKAFEANLNRKKRGTNNV